jgi:hypothetical protein
LVDGQGQVASFGMKLGDDPAHGVLAAVYEAFQLRAALASRPQGPSTRSCKAPAGDEARADFLTTAAGQAAMQEWFLCWQQACREPSPARKLTLAARVAAIVADGGRPVATELTDRLPQPIRKMGWRVAKAVIPGFQPLRIDDCLEWTWNRRRVATVAARYGVRPDSLRWNVPHFMV